MNLVFLDLDKTLVDTNYQLTVSEDEFRNVVRSLLEKNTLVGLCSDSSVTSLRQWAERLELTGPIVAERGAVIWDPISETREEVVSISETGWLQDLKRDFLGKVTGRFPGATLVVGDATEFIRQNTTFPSMAKQVLVVNGFRVASFSFFARRFSSVTSTLERDAEFLRETAEFTEELVVSLGRKKEELFWDEGREYAILIIHSKTTEKCEGVERLAKRYHPQNIVMVGDSSADYLNLSKVTQFAVGNASEEYKSKCGFVSNHHFTKGVIDGLQQLA